MHIFAEIRQKWRKFIDTNIRSKIFVCKQCQGEAAATTRHYYEGQGEQIYGTHFRSAVLLAKAQ
jgi:hypothetical protein